MINLNRGLFVLGVERPGAGHHPEGHHPKGGKTLRVILYGAGGEQGLPYTFGLTAP